MKSIFFFFLISLFFILGVYSGYKKTFPVSAAIYLKERYIFPQNELVIYGDINAASDFHGDFVSYESISDGYKDLYNVKGAIFELDSSGCPSFYHPFLVAKSFYCNKLVYVETGFVHYSLLLRSGGVSDKLVVYNHGHGGFPLSRENFATDFIDEILIEGYDVLITSMPLTGLNASQKNIRFPTPDGEGLVPDPSILGHALFEASYKKSINYLRYFIDDAVLFVLHNNQKYNNVSFVGHSGGAWSGVHICAALKKHVKKCFLSSGVMPLDIRVSAGDRNIGDAEQISHVINNSFPVTSAILGMEGLVDIMLYFDVNDPCCFNGASPILFEEKMKALGGKSKFVIKSEGRHGFPKELVKQFILD